MSSEIMATKRDLDDIDEGEIEEPEQKRPKTLRATSPKIMATEREADDIDEGEIEDEPEQKRSKTHQNPKKQSRQHQNSGIDPTWGQKYVFSGLAGDSTIPPGEESDFEDDADAMAYLTSVRQEASGIPHLLVAPKTQIGPQLPPELQADQESEDPDGQADDDEPADRGIYMNGIGDTRGYYEDGAYVARPHDWEDRSTQYEDVGADGSDNVESSAEAVQDGYHKSLLSHYIRLREALRMPLPRDTSARLPPSYVTRADPLVPGSKTTRIWTRQILDHDPHPLQMAQLSKDSLIRILRVLLAGRFLHRGQPIPERTSRWLWALLAMLPDRGELNHEEIGWVRDLGRRAVLLGRSLAEMAALRDELEDGDLGVNEGVDASSSDDGMLADVEGEYDDSGEPNDEDGADGLLGSEDPEEDIAVPPGQDAAQSQPQLDHLDVPEKGEVRNEEEKEKQEGEGEDEDVAMDLDSDSDSDSSQEDGEVDEERDGGNLESLQDAKERLLARLQAEAAADEAAEEAAEREREAAQLRSRMNMRATLCMILTVAGEFYGQRDLLEFREPFVGL